MDSLKLRAYAKINLALEIKGRLENGYHDLEMIMQSVGIYDTLSFELTEDEGIQLKCGGKRSPSDERNLVYKALRLIMDKKNIRKGIRVSLTKNIPTAAGLAGGSSDAASAVYAANILFDLGMDRDEMLMAGLEIGSDVPFCLTGGTCLAKGQGEKLTPLSPLKKGYIVLAKPFSHLSTKKIFSAFDEGSYPSRGEAEGFAKALEKGASLKELAPFCANALYAPALEYCPETGVLVNKLSESGAVISMMSGSGPSVFGIFEDKAMAKDAQKNVKALGMCEDVFLTNFADRPFAEEMN